MAEIDSTCPRCGARNTSGAWMCWRCNSNLVSAQAPTAAPPVERVAPPAPPAAPTSVTTHAAPPPGPAPDQAALLAVDYNLSLLSTARQQKAPTRQPILWMLAIASLALLIVTPMVLKGVLPKTSGLPASIQGYTRVDHDPDIERAKAELAKAALQEGTSVTAAVYRQAGKGMVVEVYSGISPELTATDLLDQLSESFKAKAGTTIDGAQVAQTYGANGVTQACAPMSGNLNGAVCYWADLKKVGLIVGVNADVTETSSLAEQVRDLVSD